MKSKSAYRILPADITIDHRNTPTAIDAVADRIALQADKDLAILRQVPKLEIVKDSSSLFQRKGKLKRL